MNAQVANNPKAHRDRHHSTARRTNSELPITLSIVSNSQLLREGLPTLLTPYFKPKVLSVHTSEVPDAWDNLPNLPDHVVLVDCRIGPDPAIAWTRGWRTLEPPAVVVIMELARNNELIVDCIAAGGCAYTLEGASIAELADTVLLARRGLARCPMDIAPELFSRLEAAENRIAALPQVQQTVSPLSYREMEVVQCITEGYSNKEIAEELVISLSTVKHHVHNILSKLDVPQRTDVAQLAVQEGWITID